MSFSVNKVILVGNLANVNEVKVSKSGVAIMNFSVATNRSIKKGEGEWEDVASFHRITAFGKKVEVVQRIGKGDKVYVEGRLEYSKYTNKDGVEVYKTDIIADNIISFKRKENGSYNSNTQHTGDENQDTGSEPDTGSQETNYDDGEIKLEDIPF